MWAYMEHKREGTDYLGLINVYKINVTEITVEKEVKPDFFKLQSLSKTSDCIK